MLPDQSHIPIDINHLTNWMDQFDVLNPIQVVTSIKSYQHPNYIITSTPESIPITCITSQADIYQVLDQLEQKLQLQLVNQLGYKQAVVFRFLTTIAELCQNIYYHSIQRGNRCGYATMQTDQNCLKFMALDLGPGIPFTLKHKYTFETDADAIYLATQPGITSKSHGGLGLYRTAQITAQAGGTLIIRSGQASVTFHNKDIQTKNASSFKAVKNTWGTQIGILLPRNRCQSEQLT